jgi:hypothetical protein
MVIKGDIDAAIAKVKALKAARQPFSYQEVADKQMSHIALQMCVTFITCLGRHAAQTSFTLGGHHCLIAKGFGKGTTGFCLCEPKIKHNVLLLLD